MDLSPMERRVLRCCAGLFEPNLFEDPTARMEAVFNEILDARAIAAGEYDPTTNDDEIVVAG